MEYEGTPFEVGLCIYTYFLIAVIDDGLPVKDKTTVRDSLSR